MVLFDGKGYAKFISFYISVICFKETLYENQFFIVNSIKYLIKHNNEYTLKQERSVNVLMNLHPGIRLKVMCNDKWR